MNEADLSADFHETYVEDRPPPPSDRATGLTLAAIAAVLALLNRHHGLVLPILVGLAAILAGFSLLAPRLLGPLNRAWFAFGRLMHHVMSPLVMGIVFVVAVLPIGLLMRPFHDPLRRRRLPDAETYWIALETGEAARSSMVNQF